MISFNYEVAFKLPSETQITKWLTEVIKRENCKLGDVNFIFCEDEYLLKLNMEFLQHDTLTDIISFDYSVGKELHGDIFISKERVQENAESFEVEFDDEIKRVMVHGVLHYCGYKDKTDDQSRIMREKENHYLNLFAKIQ